MYHLLVFKRRRNSLRWLFHLNFTFVSSFDLPSTSRRLLDTELHCKDGLVMASSHVLALNSVVFEKMLFSTVQMEESKTNTVHLDDVLMVDVEFLLKFYEFRVEGVVDYFNQLETARLMSLISITHLYEFKAALGVLCKKLVKLIPVPSPTDLQYSDKLQLEIALKSWSVNCRLPNLYETFVNSLRQYPLSDETVRMFSTAHRNYVEELIRKQRS